MINILYSIIIYPITQIIEFVFVLAQNLFKETGLSIICVSAAVSIFCLPLYLVAEGWQEVERNVQKKLTPKISKIKTVYKGDEQYMLISAYYRQNHYHPVYAMRSTFGLLIQIPFFIAAYTYISHLEVLKGESFLFIADLAKPDKLIPIAGGINFLLVFMTLINCTAGAVYSKGLGYKDKIQLYGIALVFLALLYNSPSALVLYWTLNNIFSLLKNIYLKIPFGKKHYILFSIISIIALVLSFYILFLLRGSPKVRSLIAVLLIIAGILPWIIPLSGGLIKKIKHIPWTLKESLHLFVFSTLVLWLSSGIFLPSMLIESSPQEFSFIDDIVSPLFFVFNASVQAFGLFVFWPFMIYLLFPEKIKKILSLLMAVISISALINIFIFPGNYGTISVNLGFSGTVSHNIKAIAVNIFILAIISAVLIFFHVRNMKKTFSFLLITLSAALISFSVKMLYTINSEYKKLAEYYTGEYKIDDTISPVFHLSKTGRNVLVIMLDMAESVFIPYITGENPELKQKYDGFIYYPNTVTFNGWTAGGAPPLFGGYEYTPAGINRRPEVTLKEKTNESLVLMPLLFSEAGFTVTMTDPPFADNNWIPDLRIFSNIANIHTCITDGAYTDNWLKQNDIVLPLHSEILKRNFLWYSIFREVPLAFRQAVYNNGSWCAPYSENRMRLFLNGYAVLDFLDEITGFEQENNNSFVFMVNNTTHEGLFLQAPEYTPRVNVTDYGKSRFSKEVWYHVNMAAINRLADYFDFLKTNNVYDNTRIILVSDHAGSDTTYITKTGLPFHVDQFNPLLLVKDFDSKGEMRTEMTFMSNADVPSLAMTGLIENPVNPFTGNTIDNDQKKDPLLILIHRIQKKNNAEIDLDRHNTYYVHDNIFEAKNWIPASGAK